MARTRSITSIEAEISKVSSELKQAQEKADALSQRLLELQQMREAYESKQVMEKNIQDLKNMS
mgnify:CR=1 FL=1